MSEKVEQLKQRAEELLRQPHQTSEQIHKTVETAWESKFADTAQALKLSIKALEIAIKNNYQRGRAYALRNTG